MKRLRTLQKHAHTDKTRLLPPPETKSARCNHQTSQPPLICLSRRRCSPLPAPAPTYECKANPASQPRLPLARECAGPLPSGWPIPQLHRRQRTI